ncbi:MAG: efflux RND transporter periplasmic adaptor subunit [Gammaproteobacteria bacterium]|nr:MAG: efflux RND transporter periplasmic adaptor subunit [Gammaproteobacteria bacterium]
MINRLLEGRLENGFSVGMKAVVIAAVIGLCIASQFSQAEQSVPEQVVYDDWGGSGNPRYPGRDYGGRDSGRRDYGDREYGGRESSGGYYGSREYGGRDYGSREYGGREYERRDYGARDDNFESYSTQGTQGRDSWNDYGAKRAARDNKQHVPVRVMEVGGSATLGGTVIPFQDVTLAAQMPGRIEYIAGVEGDWFKSGDELIRIDDDDLLAQQRAAYAALHNANEAMRNANVQYSRELWNPQSRNINRMPGMGMPSLFDQFFTKNMGNMMGYGDSSVERYSDLVTQSTQLNQSRSQVLQAQSRLDEIAAKLRDTRSVAPFDGVIAKKLVEVGDTVQPGQHLLVYSDLEYLQVKVDVPARLMQGLRGQEFVTVRLDDPKKSVVQGRIAQKYPVADATRHTVTVKIDLRKDAPATPGMYAEVIVPEPSARIRKSVVIPIQAVMGKTRGSMPVVYVVNERTGQEERRYVRLGTEVDSENVVVLSGLQENDIVVIKNWR